MNTLLKGTVRLCFLTDHITKHLWAFIKLYSMFKCRLNKTKFCLISLSMSLDKTIKMIDLDITFYSAKKNSENTRNDWSPISLTKLH